MSKQNNNKTKCIATLLAIVLLTTLMLACIAVSSFFLVSSVKADDGIAETSTLNLENKYLPKPESGTPLDVAEAKDNIFIAQQVLQDAGSFKAETVGQATASIATQKVRALRVVIGESVYKSPLSFGTLVKFGEQRYSKNGKHVYRIAKSVSSNGDVVWEGGNALAVTEQSYIDAFGSVPISMTGYVLNDDSVLTANITFEEGKYIITADVDPAIGCFYSASEAKHNGGLREKPSPKYLKLVLQMDERWNIISVNSKCEYTAVKDSIPIPAKTTEDVTETFSEIGQVTEPLPYADFFEKHLNDPPGPIKPSGNESGLLGLFSTAVIVIIGVIVAIVLVSIFVTKHKKKKKLALANAQEQQHIEERQEYQDKKQRRKRRKK